MCGHTGDEEKYTEEEVTYFEVGNDKDLARAVVEAQRTPKGERAREKALTFSVERMCESHERVLNNGKHGKHGNNFEHVIA